MPDQSRRSLRRGPAAVVLATLIGVLTAVFAPVAAHAAGYQFWGYYQQSDGAWGFAAEGAGTTVPEDGAVEGWRFAVAADDDTRFPRAAPAFEEVCGDAPEAADGEKRVAVVVDFGRDVDAPEGETPPEPTAACVIAPEASTGQQLVTLLVEDVRTDSSGLICGLGGFPADGCGDPVADPTEEQLAADEPVDIAVGPPVGGGAAGEPTDEPTDEPETTEGDDTATEEDTPAETTGEATSEDATTEDGTETEDGATDEADDGTGAEDATETADTAGDPGEDSDGPTQDVAEDGDGGMPIWAWILIGVVVIGALLGAVVGATRRRDQERDAGVDQDI